MANRLGTVVLAARGACASTRSEHLAALPLQALITWYEDETGLAAAPVSDSAPAAFTEASRARDARLRTPPPPPGAVMVSGMRKDGMTACCLVPELRHLDENMS
jgi:hypothetical protein